MSDLPKTALAAEVNPSWRWFARGMRAGLTMPGLILATAFIGFGSLAREEGYSLAEASFMTLTMWALPSIVVLMGAIKSGATLFGAAFAVALSAVRLMPMVVALVPEMRTPRTRTWVLYVLSHFVAVTSWVMAFQRFPGIPREMRTAFYGGLATWLLIANLAVVAVVFTVAPALPPTIAAALLLITPMYFLTSLWGSARDNAGKLALAVGIVLGPVCHAFVPSFDLLAAGLLGGGVAYAFHRIGRNGPA
jgi:predicted branched-subunit amino acid permease